MELVRGIHNILPRHHGCVLTIGKFDGVHEGHRAVLRNLIEQAKVLNLPAVVMVFEPQPEEVFFPEQAPARLSSLREKYEQLRDIGIDRLVCIKFVKSFAAMTAEAFITDLLVQRLGTKFLVVGDDFRFGYQRSGDFKFLKASAEKFDFEVVNTQSYRLENCRISSTEIRKLLALSEFEKVKQMLGRPYTIAGRVVHGDKLGRQLGFPTANVRLHHRKSMAHGVFAVIIRWQKHMYLGVANLGNKPTLNGRRLQLEVNIFDFCGDLYGQRIEVELVAKIRDEKKFANIDALKNQIKIDVLQAKDLLNSREHGNPNE
ncbi:bifunctional riboflavin kinase/FAD synthetase [Agaribacter flavus]|uniref:Riboflavin biosynthesis protein n=1 Tax=Agaribacter flavus TaxID=1902781 RepID=A0ABV7FUI1_9ALTE